MTRTPVFRLARVFFASLLLLVLCPSPHAAVLLSGFRESLVAGNLSAPIAMAFAPDGRLFVCEQGGTLRVIKNGTLLTTPFLTLQNVDASNERGLLGVAFDPGFSTNNYVYVSYTVAATPAHNRISRFTADGDVALPNSEVVIFELNDQRISAGLGGAIDFGADGKLYTAVGTNEYTPSSDAQMLTNFWGKMLRINPDGTIPTDNPFYTQAVNDNRAIWSLGLRVPFTFAVQPGTTRMFINDVGDHMWEEVNEGVAGANYGWPETEGPTTNPAHRGPFYYYGHGPGDFTGCAITGGAFYNPTTRQFPRDYIGDYFFADYCNGWINKLDFVNGNTVTEFATGISFPVDLKVGAEGSLYYLERGTGSVYKIRYKSGKSRR
ncbi:hypothetical protein BH20ACI3_BH20ACI3_14440 [soil metagenome]